MSTSLISDCCCVDEDCAFSIDDATGEDQKESIHIKLSAYIPSFIMLLIALLFFGIHMNNGIIMHHLRPEAQGSGLLLSVALYAFLIFVFGAGWVLYLKTKESEFIMEIWDVYDVHRQKKAKTTIRGNLLEPGDFHMVVHVCIINQKNQMLIQQRQKDKFGFANHWDLTIGGSATTGDTSQMAAQRELFEELGIVISLLDQRPVLTVNFDFGFDDYYVVEQEIDLLTLKLQTDEVQAVKWALKEEIMQMIDQGLFIPYHKPLIALLFDTRNKRSAITLPFR